MPLSEQLRVSAVDEMGKQVFKTFSIKKYTKEGAEKLAAEWKEYMKKRREDDRKRSHKKTSTAPDMLLSDSDSDYSSDSDESVKNEIVMPEIFKVKDFALNLPDPKFGCSILLCSSTRGGKTTMLNHVYKTYFKEYITCTHTYSPQSDIYKDLKKDTVYCPQYMPELLKDTYKINKATNNKYKFLHIVDDCVSVKNDKRLKDALCIYRNSRISTIITGQNLTIFNSITRSNINFVMLGKLNSDMAIEMVIKSYLRSYFPKFMSLNDCIKEYKRLTTNYHFIILDNINNDAFISKVKI
jgi:hypothetical protein